MKNNFIRVKSPFMTALTALSLTALVITAFTACGENATAQPGVIGLQGSWKIIEDKGDAPAAPGFNDSGVRDITIPGNWDEFLQNNDNLAADIWLRKKFIPGKEFSHELLILSLGNFGVVDRAYVNGRCIGGNGMFPEAGRPLSYQYAWHRVRNYQFDSSILDIDKENVIAIRVYSHVINGVQARPALYTLTAWDKARWFYEYLPSLNNSDPLFLSILLLILLFIIVKGMGNRAMALYSLAFIAGVFCVNMLMIGFPRFENNIYRYKYFLGIYALVDFTLLLLIQEFFNIKSRTLTVIALVILLGVISIILYAPETRFLIGYGGPVTTAAIIFYICSAMGVFITALYRDPRRYWYLVIWAAVILVSVTNTLHSLITGKYYLLSFSFAVRLPIILLGAVLVYIFDLKKIKKERDSLTKILLKKNKELQKANRLIPRVESRPEPRDAIHDLVEYLDTNYNETYDRKALAQQFRLNDDYMGQLFKKVTGTNIANYINGRRIEASMQLLRETDSKVIDIAFHVGFDNLTYFYRHFKKHTGYSPVEYRQISGMATDIRKHMDDDD
ncbi:MAG: hypothetical protein CVV44_20710 [Spirochaetae bacterium HGW-Spirochaetae-1]|jgi:two-component system response regulator YesN|nr:MAG: hypothetical protein CVV44_20710 [Spirochaetae bacterium HGW-Spirochaetae-1]